jgi:hypothetical protein
MAGLTEGNPVPDTGVSAGVRELVMSFVVGPPEAPMVIALPFNEPEDVLLKVLKT